MSTPTPPMIATQDDLNRGAFAKIVKVYLAGNDPSYLDARLAGAAQTIEDLCGGRRFMPFTVTENSIADGINIDQGMDIGLRDMGGFAANLDFGRPSSYGDLVRDLWVDETPPTRTDLWTYSDVSISIRPLWGGWLTVDSTMFVGPDETGHITLNLGVVCPIGSRVTITYSGGYQPYPLALVEACRLETVRQLMLEIDPGHAQHIDETELLADIYSKLDPYGVGKPK